MMHVFCKGDHVKVLSNKYLEVPRGTIGIIQGTYSTTLRVTFANIDNPRSQYNCFYYKAKELEMFIETERSKHIMEGNYRIAQVKFLDGNNTDRTYLYACYDLSINVGDICVVKSAHHGLGIARVVEIGNKTDEKIIREIICKCDFTAYEDREKVRKRKAELVKLMNDRAAALQEIALFKMLAESDSGMRDMVSEYEKLEEAM